MSESTNMLPVRTYIRTRQSTIVRDVQGLSSGNVALNLDKPSTITVTVISDQNELSPYVIVAAIGRTPTTMDFDVIITPAMQYGVKPVNPTMLNLPAGQTTLQWAAFNSIEQPEAFSTDMFSRLAITIDQ
ncbi:MAG: hypothetical protein ABFD54_05000 [Armatimonadota bacterium]|nr:hypothetical protein [bacterium]